MGIGDGGASLSPANGDWDGKVSPSPAKSGTVPGTVPDCRRVPSSRTLMIVGSLMRSFLARFDVTVITRRGRRVRRGPNDSTRFRVLSAGATSTASASMLRTHLAWP